MDTSKEYVKMCEKAVEIQSLFKAEMGDWYNCTCVGLNEYSTGMGITVIAYNDSDLRSELLIESRTDTWLPRQDQLQEMLNKDHNPSVLDELLCDFYRFSFSGKTNLDFPWNKKTVSMEQLWLAFVMKELYNKTWNGEDWIIS